MAEAGAERAQIHVCERIISEHDKLPAVRLFAERAPQLEQWLRAAQAQRINQQGIFWHRQSVAARCPHADIIPAAASRTATGTIAATPNWIAP